MKKQKTRKKPKSRQRQRHAKKRLARSLKTLRKKSKIPKLVPEIEEEPDFLKEIKRTPEGSRTYVSKKPVHPYAATFQKTEWMGLLTLKLHTHAYSKNDLLGVGKKNRFEFLSLVMKNLCNRKFGIKESELKWVACEEFGSSGIGHVHVFFSFDYLKAKGRADKIPKIDFSEARGEFYREALESVHYEWRKLSKNRSAVDLDWSPMWENEGLVDYFCKLEDDREDKHFEFSKYWEVHDFLKAA